MPIITKKFLNDLGIELKESDYELLSEHFEKTLYERVFSEVVMELTPEQAKQLADIEPGGDERVMTWLQANVLDLPEIVSDEIDILLGEIAENSDAINSTSKS